MSRRTGIWTRSQIDEARMQSGEIYHEFLVIPAMSAGTYELRGGQHR